jgi:hypothetical protein
MTNGHRMPEITNNDGELERVSAFYQNLFRLNPLLDTGRMIAMDVVNRNVLLLLKKELMDEPFPRPGEVVPSHGQADLNWMEWCMVSREIQSWKQRLEFEGITVENVCAWPSGAQSLFFRDLDRCIAELMVVAQL